jgi:hypothetical protein
MENLGPQHDQLAKSHFLKGQSWEKPPHSTCTVKFHDEDSFVSFLPTTSQDTKMLLAVELI